MPTYEYRCEECGLDFERFQKITDCPVKECPECGGKVERLVGIGAGIILKGTGFYKNEYGSKNRRPSCGRRTTCCGREESCDMKTCESQ